MKLVQYLFFADGAVFGYWLQILLKEKMEFTDIELRLFLPTSFEYLVLLSELVPIDRDILVNTSEYCDSEIYYSYESFFYRKLQEATNKRPIPEWLLERLGGRIRYKKFKIYKKSAKDNAFLDDILLSEVGIEYMKNAIGEIENIETGEEN